MFYFCLFLSAALRSIAPIMFYLCLLSAALRSKAPIMFYLCLFLLSAPLRSNGADYVLLLFIFIFYFIFFSIHRSFSETT